MLPAIPINAAVFTGKLNDPGRIFKIKYIRQFDSCVQASAWGFGNAGVCLLQAGRPICIFFLLGHDQWRAKWEKVARYSFIARDPELVFTSKGHAAKILRFVKGQHKPEKISFSGSPLSVVRELMKDYRAEWMCAQACRVFMAAWWDI